MQKKEIAVHAPLKAVLLDLDGTLLPMDQEEFTKGYFGLLARKVAPLGYEPKALVDAIWSGTAAMVKNDGATSNESAFWNRFSALCGEKALRDKPVFDEFYQTEFEKAKEFCGFDPRAAEAVAEIKGMGLRTVLATNPIFPAVATQARIRWAGMDPSDFEFITTYENSSFCKPNTDYYVAVAELMGLQAEECLMVGNDVTEDMVARDIGMKVFLLTDHLINQERKDINQFPRGSFAQLLDFIKEVME